MGPAGCRGAYWYIQTCEKYVNSTTRSKKWKNNGAMQSLTKVFCRIFWFFFVLFFFFLTARCVWSSSSRSISAKSTFPWSPIRTRSGRFSSTPSSSCSLWVATAHQTRTSCICWKPKLCGMFPSSWVKHVFWCFWGWTVVGRSQTQDRRISLCCPSQNTELHWRYKTVTGKKTV